MEERDVGESAEGETEVGSRFPRDGGSAARLEAGDQEVYLALAPEVRDLWLALDGAEVASRPGTPILSCDPASSERPHPTPSRVQRGWSARRKSGLRRARRRPSGTGGGTAAGDDAASTVRPEVIEERPGDILDPEPPGPMSLPRTD